MSKLGGLCFGFSLMAGLMMPAEVRADAPRLRLAHARVALPSAFIKHASSIDMRGWRTMTPYRRTRVLTVALFAPPALPSLLQPTLALPVEPHVPDLLDPEPSGLGDAEPEQDTKEASRASDAEYQMPPILNYERPNRKVALFLKPGGPCTGACLKLEGYF